MSNFFKYILNKKDKISFLASLFSPLPLRLRSQRLKPRKKREKYRDNIKNGNGDIKHGHISEGGEAILIQFLS